MKMRRGLCASEYGVGSLLKGVFFDDIQLVYITLVLITSIMIWIEGIMDLAKAEYLLC